MRAPPRRGGCGLRVPIGGGGRLSVVSAVVASSGQWSVLSGEGVATEYLPALFAGASLQVLVLSRQDSRQC